MGMTVGLCSGELRPERMEDPLQFNRTAMSAAQAGGFFSHAVHMFRGLAAFIAFVVVKRHLFYPVQDLIGGGALGQQGEFFRLPIPGDQR